MVEKRRESERASAGDAKTTWVRMGRNCMVEQKPDGSLKDIITDGKGSVVATGDASGDLKARGYTAYGYAPPGDSTQSALGYNGEYTDPVTGNYHLGNGYRAFNPALMRFTAPDSLSPFGGGGLNTYAYCAGDPINAIDPSGHSPKWPVYAFLGFALAGFAAGSLVLAFKALAQFVSVEGEALEDIGSTRLEWGRFGLRGHGMPPLKDAGPVVSQGAIDDAHTQKLMLSSNSNGLTFTRKLDNGVVESHGRTAGPAELRMNFSGRDGDREAPQQPSRSRANTTPPRAVSPVNGRPPRASTASSALSEQSVVRSRSVSSSSTRSGMVGEFEDRPTRLELHNVPRPRSVSSSSTRSSMIGEFEDRPTHLELPNVARIPLRPIRPLLRGSVETIELTSSDESD
jgi:RHS repeat-associated protein